MWQIPTKVDFYITNVCNLTCQGCNRFNNYNFRGWQRWADYAEIYQAWSDLVSLRAVTIMGGEPFLNPTLVDWVQGINQLFDVEVQILTNGTRFVQAPDVYKALLFKSTKNNNCPNHIGVSLHNPEQMAELDADIRNFLRGPVVVYAKGHPDNRFQSDYMYVDINDIVVNVYTVNKFATSSLMTTESGHFKLHNSNPEIAHQNCSFVQFKSYHFIKGQLYKCGPAALMPEFDQQHTICMSDEDRMLLNSYKPLNPDNFAEYHKEFFDNIDKPIPQCKFCPESYQFTTITPIRKGKIDV